MHTTRLLKQPKLSYGHKKINNRSLGCRDISRVLRSYPISDLQFLTAELSFTGFDPQIWLKIFTSGAEIKCGSVSLAISSTFHKLFELNFLMKFRLIVKQVSLKNCECKFHRNSKYQRHPKSCNFCTKCRKVDKDQRSCM